MRTARRLTRALAVLAGLSLLSANPAAAQFIPYFGKNKVKYDTFAWRIYKSPHFEVYYYPEFEQHLGRLTSYLESSYQKVSGELKHEIPFQIPVILYKTHSEFEQTNLFPAFVPEGVLAFAEPVRDRMVLPIDLAPDKLQGLITHELTHVFEFDLIPRGFIQRGVPLWVDEGLADYLRGTWATLDLMMVRDAAVADEIPRMSRADDLSSFGNPRLTYNLGHAVFEFMEQRYGKEGIRQFLYTLRKNVIGGSAESIYQQAFRIKPNEFDKAFEKWLKERFKPFRDKQRPSDYGTDLAPDSERTSYTQVFGFSPSPSGDLIAAVTGNRAEGEADIVLLSSQSSDVVRNLTSGFTGRYESLSFPEEFVASRSLSFSPQGDVIAFFARAGKRRSLFLVSVLDGKLVAQYPLDLDQSESPCLLPDGRHVIFNALREGVSDLYLLDLETGQSRNLTQDEFADSNPQVSPDGRLVVYNRRISGAEKVFVFPITDPSRKTQLTFGTQDDAAPIFSRDGQTVFFASNEDEQVFNIRGLNLNTGVLSQYTDVLGSNMAPAPIAGEQGDRVAFISYFKGEYQLNAISIDEPLREIEQQVETATADLIDFQPDVTHQVVPENKRRKHLFEGLMLEGRPPLNVGVTSSGDFFGGSQVALTDVLGDQNLVITALSLREFRSYSGTYVNLASRLHWGVSLFDSKRFFFDNRFVVNPGFDFRAGLLATQRFLGATASAEYPLDKFRRVELSAGVIKIQERYEDPLLQFQAEQEAAATGRSTGLRDGLTAPLSVFLTQETTRFAGFGPLAGSTFRIGGTVAASLGDQLSFTTVEGDARKYLRLGPTSSLLALRVRGFKSMGERPDFFYFGGNMELRGYPYLSLVGNEGFHANVELRFPIIHLAATPIGILGPIRGTFFAGIGAARFKGDAQYDFASSEDGVSFVNYPGQERCFVDPTPACNGEPVSGFHLVDGRASFGFGLQAFIFGYPMHFDWTKLTDLKVVSDDTRFDFWIGFDF